MGDRRARYLRIYGTQRGTQWGYSLWEIEAVRSNARTAALRTAATALSGGTTAGSAVDGSAATGWVSSATDQEWWQTDLGAPRWMNRMTLRWGGCCGVDYKIKASLDGGVDEAAFASVNKHREHNTGGVMQSKMFYSAKAAEGVVQRRLIDAGTVWLSGATASTVVLVDTNSTVLAGRADTGF